MKISALFIDRDGVINRMVNYETGWNSPQSPCDVTLVPGIVEIIKWANKKSIPVIEISNQPGTAKGKLTKIKSLAIQQMVEKLLKDGGAKLDGIYICPHHPNGVVPDLTKECDCRKPKPGLLFMASRDMNIDLKKSVFLGDNESDALAGRAAGCMTILFLHDEDDPLKIRSSKSTNIPDRKVKSLIGVLPLLATMY